MRIPLSSKALILLATVVGIGVTIGSPPPASAHGRSVSYSNWEIDAAGANVVLRMKLLELSRLGPEAIPSGVLGSLETGEPNQDLPARAFPQQLTISADGTPCRVPETATRGVDEPGWIRYRWRVDCPADAARLTIRTRLLLDVAPSHMHFVRIRLAAAPDSTTERVLTEASPEWTLREPSDDTPTEAIGNRVIDYVELGIEHILSGWDHLAFVFGLLLLASRFGEVARLITGFTLAHSLTLALAVFDLVHPQAAAVEAVVAFSVALVAAEKGWELAGRARVVPVAISLGLFALGGFALVGESAIPIMTIFGLVLFTVCYFALVATHENGWLRICLTFAFGLVHGFGFAGILVEMTLPQDRLVPALLGFNLGVEIGQLGVVILLWPLFLIGRRWAGAGTRRFTAELSAAGLCGLGIYWLIERALSV